MKAHKTSTLAQLCAVLLLGLCAATARAEWGQPILTIAAGAVTHQFTAAELLSRADLASVQISPHVRYNVSLIVQAVPLFDLLSAFPLEGFDRLEARAIDGFVAQIPLALTWSGNIPNGPECPASNGRICWKNWPQCSPRNFVGRSSR